MFSKNPGIFLHFPRINYSIKNMKPWILAWRRVHYKFFSFPTDSIAFQKKNSTEIVRKNLVTSSSLSKTPMRKPKWHMLVRVADSPCQRYSPILSVWQKTNNATSVAVFSCHSKWFTRCLAKTIRAECTDCKSVYKGHGWQALVHFERCLLHWSSSWRWLGRHCPPAGRHVPTKLPTYSPGARQTPGPTLERWELWDEVRG